jgi:hypothetical protein
METRFNPDYRNASWRAFVATGLWLRVGFVGASVLAIALITLFTGEASPVMALAGVVAGGMVAAYSWRQSWVVLNRADEEMTAPPAPARTVGFGNRVESAASR